MGYYTLQNNTDGVSSEHFHVIGKKIYVANYGDFIQYIGTNRYVL